MSNSTKGTTYKIREQLQFLDNKKWKLFSTRRLELIDKFKLFEKKASEQDCNIERIANILRTEFDYSIEHQLEFEKLVTAAVQSVRRNRKRSKNLNGQSGSEIGVKSAEQENSFLSGADAQNGKETTSNNYFSPIQTSQPDLSNRVSKLPRSPPHSINSNLIRKHQQSKPVTVSIAVSNRSSNSDSDSSKIPSPSISPIASPMQLARNGGLLHQHSIQAFPSASVSSSNNNNNMLPLSATASNTNTLPCLNSNRIVLPPLQSLASTKNIKNKQTKTPKNEGSNIEIVKSIIADIVFQKVSLKDQLVHSSASTDFLKSPADYSSNGNLSLEFFALSSHNRDLLPIALKQPGKNNSIGSITPAASPSPKPKTYTCPFFLKSKILNQITNSKTCHDICSKQGSYRDIYQNILEMGDLGYRSCLMFTFERFYDTNTAMISYLKDKLIKGDKAEETLIQIIESLFSHSTLRDLHTLKAEYKLDLFKLCVGSLLKDFGFDGLIYSLGEIFQDYILKELSPFITNSLSSDHSAHILSQSDVSKNHSISKNSKHNSLSHNMIVSTAPLDPAMANNAIYRTVVIKKGDKRQEFTFYPLSNGTPTICEILENCSVLFGLSNNPGFKTPKSDTRVEELLQKGDERNIHNNAKMASRKAGMNGKYGLYHDNQLLKSDIELSTLLTNFTLDTKEIVLDIKEFDNGVPPVSGGSKETSPALDQPSRDGLSILSNVAFVSSKQIS